MKALTIITLILASAGCFAQGVQPYDIKGDKLGMSLEEFKKHHYSFHAGSPKLHVPDSTGPFCTDRADSEMFLSADEAAAGVVSCYPAWSVYRPGLANLNRATHAEAETLANVELQGIAFHFYKGQLFKIIVIFPAEGYDIMKVAFAEKFGAPVIIPHELQNAYGAKFDGEESNWTNGVSSIQMKRRASDLSTGGMVMLLPDIQKQVEAAMPKKPKDL